MALVIFAVSYLFIAGIRVPPLTAAGMAILLAEHAWMR